MNKIHDTQGKRIQNGSPFDWMLAKIVADLNKDILSDKINATDASRHAIVLLWRKMNERGFRGYGQIPKAALDLLKERIEDIDL